MTCGELLGRLLWLDHRLPVVFQAADGAGMAIEITAVEHLTWLPPDALVARGQAVLIVAEPGQ